MFEAMKKKCISCGKDISVINKSVIFECPKCSEFTVVYQYSFELQKPPKCSGCKNKSGFILKEPESEWEDYQEIYIQD